MAQNKLKLADCNATTGTGSFVFATSPTLTTPVLGTPASGVATNLTGTATALNIGGSAASLSISGQTGLLTVTGLASTNRIKTVRDAADTILELAGSYTPTGTWTNMPLTTPVITGLATGSGVSNNATVSTLSAYDANGNLTAVNHIEGFTTTATAAGTTTMTITSTFQQYWTGTTTQTVKLPTTSVVAGGQWSITNNSTGSVTVQSSGANTILVLGAGQSAIFTAIVATPTTAANWNYSLTDVFGINNAATASGNAYTILLGYKTNTVTNNSAATLTITLPTAGAVDGMMRTVRIFPSSAVAQTLTLVNTENSTVTAPTSTGASTTIPIQIGFIFNAATTKWSVIASV